MNKEGWEVKKMGEVFDLYQPKTISAKDMIEDGKYPVFGANGIIGKYDQYNHEYSELLMTCRGATCGTLNISLPFSWINGNAMVIHPKNTDSLIFKFIYYQLLGADLSSVITGAAQPQITRQSLEVLQFFIPPLPIQNQIVAELDELNNILDKKRKQLEELDTLAQTTFYDMFGDPVENEKGWQMMLLSDIGSIGRGVSKHRPRNAPELLGGEYPLIQTGEVARSGLYITEYTQTYSDIGLKQSKLWNKGTLCITIAANIAQTSIMNFDACFPDSIVGFKNNTYSNVVFVHYWFTFFQKILEEQAPQVAQKNINLKILNELKVIVPPLTLQNQFAERIEAIEKQKELINKSIVDVQLLYDYTMDRYFN